MIDEGLVPPRGSGPSFLRRPWRFFGAVFALFVLGGLIATYALQRYVTFPTPPRTAVNPQARVEAGGEELWLDADGNRVEAWFLPPRSSASPTYPLIIYAHGNAELIDQRAHDFDVLRAAGFAVLQVEYPGYGRSEGSPSEESVTAALVAAYDWAAKQQRIDRSRIMGFGRSLGGGAIAQLAARRPLHALVLESTFESLATVVMGYGVPRPLLLNTFDTLSVLERFEGPVLVLHGTQDRVFASRHAEILARTARRARLHLDQCGHNDCPRQWELVLGFLAENGVCSAQAIPEMPHESQTSSPC